jgi:hypothetical protein
MAKYTILALYILRKVRIHPARSHCIYDAVILGDLIAMHRKVHLFDIDIPGKITFKVNRECFNGRLNRPSCHRKAKP